jgi:hypothetical protein
VQFRWMYCQERELKKIRATVLNKAKVKRCIAEAQPYFDMFDKIYWK